MSGAPDLVGHPEEEWGQEVLRLLKRIDAETAGLSAEVHHFNSKLAAVVGDASLLHERFSLLTRQCQRLADEMLNLRESDDKRRRAAKFRKHRRTGAGKSA